MLKSRLLRASLLALPFLVGVMLVERGLSNLYWNAPEPADLYRRIKQAKAAVEFGPRYDILVFGDSTGGNGVIPQLLEERTGASAYNLSTSNYVSAVADVYLLEAYLDRHPPPQAVVVVRGIVAMNFKMPYDLVREFFQRPDIGWFLYERGYFGPEQLLHSVVAGLLPSIDHQYHLRRLLFSPPTAVSPSMILDPPVFREDPLALGYVRNDHVQTASDVQRLMKTSHDSAIGGEYLPLEENLALLARFCEVATNRGIPVVVVSSSYLADMKSDAAFMDTIQRISSQVETALAGMPGCTWHGPQPLPSSALADLFHTNHTGAVLFTQSVADALQVDLAAQRLRQIGTPVHMHAP
jgi:hypothetical protein